MNATDLIKRDHDAARAKLLNGSGMQTQRQRDYWQGVYDALHNLLLELGEEVRS